MRYVLVPGMLFLSSLLMAFAWLGHVRYRTKALRVAVLISWLIVLPEYVLNIAAIRYGHGTFTGAQMATFNLCTGVVCVALVSRYVLKERVRRKQVLGFCLMIVAFALVVYH